MRTYFSLSVDIGSKAHHSHRGDTRIFKAKNFRDLPRDPSENIQQSAHGKLEIQDYRVPRERDFLIIKSII